MGRLTQTLYPRLSSKCNNSTQTDDISAADNCTKQLESTPIKCTISTQTDEITSASKHLKDLSQNEHNTDRLQETISLTKRNINPSDISYDIRSGNDTELCKVSAIAILPDKRVCLTDGRNCKLKVFDENFSPLYTMAFFDEPIDMCHVFATTVAIVYSGIKSVDIFDIESTRATKTGSFQTKLDIVAIAKFGDDKKIAVLFSENDTLSIQIRDVISGRILRSFHCEKSEDVPLKCVETGNNRIVYREGGDILLSDKWKCYCFNISTRRTCNTHSNCHHIQECWFFKSRKGNYFKDISDFAIDQEGNIYLCGYLSNNVHQVAANDFRKYREIVTGIEKPLSIAVNSEKGLLIIGCRYDDYIHVFQFS